MPIFRKKEAERTKREKIIRDCVFFGLLIFICGMCIKTVYVMADLLEATAKLSEINYLIAQNTSEETDKTLTEESNKDFEGITGEIVAITETEETISQ